MRRVLAAGSLLLVYVAAAKAGLSLASINPSATAVWPPSGIAIAACLLMGRDAWPAIFVGAFIANLTNAGSIATSLAIAGGNTLEGVLGAYFLRRFAAGARAFDHAPDVFRFAVLSGFLATSVSATIGVTTLAVGGYAAWAQYGYIWLTWWLGDASGALIFAPLIIVLTASRNVELPRERWLEASLLLGTLLAAAAFVFGGLYEPTRHYPLAFLCIPPVVWAAFRFGPRETIAAMALLSLVATWNTHRGMGPFAVAGIASLIVLQAFMATVAIMAMAIAALVSERKRVEEERLILLSAERQARAAAEFASLSKDEFLAMLGHELRNPIGAIVTAIHVLGRSASLQGDAARARDVVVRQADTLTRLVDDLLDATRVATGKMALNRRRVDLASAAKRAIAALTTAGKTIEHDLVVDAQSVWVDGDSTRLEQVVTNLVGNSLKYTPSGGRIRVVVTSESGAAILRVTDTGIGIAPELLPHVFDLFAQGQRSLDRTEGGLGIGLTLVKRVVELHGGSVEVRSEGEGGGSEFIVRFVAAAPSPAEDRQQFAEQPSAPRRRAVRRILIVEDQADMREIMRLALESSGHLVFEAADGPSGIEAVQRLRPEVAVVDIGLPGFDGYEVARRIRTMLDGAPILLVALTGYGQPDDRHRAKAAGFDVHLVKPIEFDRLDAVLDGMTTFGGDSAPPA